MSTARSGYSQRVGSAIGGNRDAGGGVFENLPLAAFGAVPAMAYFTDFLSGVELGDWVATTVGTPAGNSAVIGNDALGKYIISSGTANNTGYGSVQLSDPATARGGIASPSSNIGTDVFGNPIKRVIGFEARLHMAFPPAGDWFFGLAAVDATFMSTAGALLAVGADNMIGFHHLNGSLGVPTLTANGSGATAQTATARGVATLPLGASQDYRFGVRIIGNNQVQWFIDGIPVSDGLTLTSGFNAGMVPTFAVISDGTSRIIRLDCVAVAQTR